MAEAKALTLVCYDGTINGSKTLSSDVGLVVIHHLHRNDFYSLPPDFDDREISGIYILVGDEGDGIPKAYIGEAGNVFTRIGQPDHKEKEWWTSVYILSRAGGDINRAMRLYIENSLINHKGIQRYNLENKKRNSYGKLNQGDKINAKRIKKEMIEGCRAIGFQLFDPMSNPTSKSENNLDVVFTLRGKKHEAYLVVKESKFILLPGTKLSPVSDSMTLKGVRALRNAFEGVSVLKKEVEFTSPSSAAAFAAGVNLSGRWEWWNEHLDKSLGQWQDGE